MTTETDYEYRCSGLYRYDLSVGSGSGTDLPAVVRAALRNNVS